MPSGIFGVILLLALLPAAHAQVQSQAPAAPTAEQRRDALLDAMGGATVWRQVIGARITATHYTTQTRLPYRNVIWNDFRRFRLHIEASNRDLTRVFTRDLARKAEVLAIITYPPETNDFGPYIRKLIEIDLRSQKLPIPDDDKERKKLFQMYVPTFDALYLPGYAEKVGLLLPQLVFYNITGKTIIGSNNWHTPDLIERAGRHAEGAVIVDGFYPENQDPAIKAVVDAYRSAYQDEPDILSAQAYDAAAMVLSFLETAKDTPAAIREGLLNMKDFPGISGTTSFTGSGEAQKKLFLIRIEDGKFTLLTD